MKVLIEQAADLLRVWPLDDPLRDRALQLAQQLDTVDIDRRTRRRSYACNIGPWARNGAKGIRYLDVGMQGRPEYDRILSVTPEGSKFYYWKVELGSGKTRSVWCGTNIYE